VASSATPRILIADDDDVLRELLVLLLATEGYSPVGVSTPEEARSAIGAEPWALILLDTLGEGPGVRAYAALTNLCEKAAGMPVMLMTGSDSTAHWGETNPAFADVALKPFEMDWFLRRVADLVPRANVPSSEMVHASGR
jgi:DNA-binding response OmpR family regulator